MPELKTKLDSYDDSYSQLKPGDPLQKYQFILQDEYNNLLEIGYFDTLINALPEINSTLSIYNVTVSLEDLENAEKNSPYGGGLDLEVYENGDEEEGNLIMIRCFVHF